MNIKHPGLALLIIFVLAAGLDLYGTKDGSLLFFDIIGGIFIYKFLTAQRR